MSFDAIAYLNDPRWRSSRLGLDRMYYLLEQLGNPQDRLKFAHVAGTNGKGSTCAFLSSILRQAGYRTGMFTSPYIERFEERIQVNGENISMEDLIEITLAVREVALTMEDHPTEFELMCAVGLEYFARKECDIVVLEVGLGGRFDATNVITAPEVCVMARIGLDHTEILGDSIAAVAGEKAGIIKEGSVVVSCQQDDDARKVFEEMCAERGCPITFVDDNALEMSEWNLMKQARCADEPLARAFTYRGERYTTQLVAAYQPFNAALALEAAFALQKRGWTISQQDMTAGIAATTWPGRFELVGNKPLGIVDGGHNPQGIEALTQTFDQIMPGEAPVFVIGLLADKDYPAMLREVVPYGCAFVCLTPPNPRALSAADLAAAIEEAKPASSHAPVVVADSPEEAVFRAASIAGEHGVVCACGSLYSIAYVKAAFAKLYEQE